MTTHVGQAMKRKEDPRMITGRTNYVDDISLPGMLYCAIVRSPEAHATIVSIDKSAAEERTGVVAVFPGRKGVDTCGNLGVAPFDDSAEASEENQKADAVEEALIQAFLSRCVGQLEAVAIAKQQLTEHELADWQVFAREAYGEEFLQRGAWETADHVRWMVAHKWEYPNPTGVGKLMRALFGWTTTIGK